MPTMLLIVFSIAVFVTGFLLIRSTPPYGVLVFAIHKLASIAILALLCYHGFRIHKADGWINLSMLFILIAVITLLLAAVSGSMIAVGHGDLSIARLGHRVVPWLNLLAVIGFVAVSHGKR